jgi:hypothetical protein
MAFQDYESVNAEMTRNKMGDRFLQLSPRGLGYFIIEVGPEVMSLINVDLLSIFKLMGESTSAAGIFGGFSRKRQSEECLIQDNARKAIVLKQSEKVFFILESTLKNVIRNKTKRTESVQKVIVFLDALSRFLKNQPFFKDMVRNNKDDDELIIMFSIMITMFLSTDQAEHFDYSPEGAFLSFSLIMPALLKSQCK